jgi:hypothetical protein
MNDGTGLAEALLGLDGFRVLTVTDMEVEVVIEIETTPVLWAVASAAPGRWRTSGWRWRSVTWPVSGAPFASSGNKRRWRCVDPDWEAKTWTESSACFSTRALMTRRAGAEACRQVGENARPVSQMAEELGVCWWTVMAAVIEYGTPLVEDPGRVGPVTQLGVDETYWLPATPLHPTLYATGLVDLDRRILIDMVEGNAAADLRKWSARQDPA